MPPLDFKAMTQMLYGFSPVQTVAENPFARRNAVNGAFMSEGAVRPYAGGPVYRGVGAGVDREAATRPMESFNGIGDIGKGTYVTPQKWLAETYGGGPKANVRDGSRVVHQYQLEHTPPENVAYVNGGAGTRGPRSIVAIRDGTGRELYRGPWRIDDIEATIAKHPQIKLVVGDGENSIGINQISVRDPSLLK